MSLVISLFRSSPALWEASCPEPVRSTGGVAGLSQKTAISKDQPLEKYGAIPAQTPSSVSE